MIKFLQLVVYWAPRLPWKFTIPLVLLMLGWLAFVSAALRIFKLAAMADFVAWVFGLPYLGKEYDSGAFSYFTVALRVFFEGIVAVLILGLGILASYNLAVALYRKIRGSPQVTVHDPVAPTQGSDSVLEKFQQQRDLEDLRIGIILAGGGAKGAYQAGAMKAIHEFLEANKALNKVRMIAGTSIGSWNAMFWLAGLIKSPGPNVRSIHEQWWRGICVDRIMEFEPYFLLAQNYFLNTKPWQEAFESIFVGTSSVKKRLDALFHAAGSTGAGQAPIHFYFTRSNVEQGHLEFATNNTFLPNITRPKWGTPDPNDTEEVVPRDRYELIEAKAGVDPLQRSKIAVFASMDLPPLFSYVTIRTDRDELFEDGGVVDNLPMRFGTEIEDCNLLFVLPLNASFEEEAAQNSVIRRLFRVMDVRQGVLERDSIKLARLYNDQRWLVRELISRDLSSMKEDNVRCQWFMKFSRTRIPDLVSVFAICPEQPLKIGTAEFWKPDEAGEAFDLMYSVTKLELQQNFFEATDPNSFRMALVSPRGGRKYVYEF